MLTSIDVKFIFDKARLGLFGSANILQIIANDALESSSCCSCQIFSFYFAWFLLLERVKSPPFLFSQLKQLNLVPRSFRLTMY